MSGMKRIQLSLLLPLFFCMSTGVVSAKERVVQFCAEVTSGTTVLIMTSNAPAEGMWLGITFYPPKVKDAAKEGVSQILPLKKGQNTTEIEIPSRFRNGTFEAAVWGRKLSKREIAASDVAAQNLGYKLVGMVSYLWGYLTAP